MSDSLARRWVQGFSEERESGSEGPVLGSALGLIIQHCFLAPPQLTSDTTEIIEFESLAA